MPPEFPGERSEERGDFGVAVTLVRLVRKVREAGAFYAATLALRRVLPARVLYLGHLVLLEMRPARERGTDRTDSIPKGVRWAASDDTAQLTSFGHSIELVQQRLSAGDRVCVLTEDGRLLGYVWFHSPQHVDKELGVRFELAPGEIWLFDAMISPAHRGRGLYPSLLKAAAADLWTQGFNRILIAVEASNRNSVKAHLAAGALRVGSIRALRLLGLTVVHDRVGFMTSWTGVTGWLALPSHRLTTLP